ncbi:poly(U)-specific endoribonuclease homolog [Belonocnema kinseyi]|uniref:poly(U)-specific endoribonuclease homolog n=1 Tax=Belonocnema kinseyi TaxID=2817044 RepID=UPI00143D35B3|nr:poly(U)-specific endoribonuclease homolog [Belonocnema kinseyi]
MKLTWFRSYLRKKNVFGSSGFENVYLIEKKIHNKLIGLHNWIYFAEEELSGRLNYLGYTRYVKLNDKAVLVNVQFSFDELRKGSSFFIGTPPEVEIALDTVCFYVKPGKSCRIYTQGNTFTIQTYVKKSEGNNLVASAYPRL